MIALGRLGVKALWPFLLLAALLWYCVLLSGVHATIAGVLAAIAIPIRITPGAPDAADSPLHRLEHALHPWSAYLIVPLFGFANAGVHLEGNLLSQIAQPLPLAVTLGLFLGKQAGIFGAIFGCVKLGLAPMPRGATWAQVHGLALLCGIGFTMSLFIGGLAFPARPSMSRKPSSASWADRCFRRWPAMRCCGWCRSIPSMRQWHAVRRRKSRRTAMWPIKKALP